MKIIFSANSYVHLYKLRLEVIKRLISEGHEIIAVGANDEYKEKIENEGIKCLSINISPNSTNVFSDLKLLINYITLYRKIKPDTIFHSTIKPNIYGSIASSILKIKTINNISGLGTVFFKENVIKSIVIKLYQFSQKKVFRIFFQNKYDMELFTEMKICTHNQAKKIPGSGINVDKFDSKKFKKNKRNDNFEFTYIGRLVKEKGIYEFIEAAQLITKKFQNIDFKIIGDYDVNNKSSISKNFFEKVVNENNNIIHNSYVDDVRQSIVNSNCIVLPSWREGLSNILLESCSLETPVITSNTPGCKDVVIHQYNGLLCSPKNALDLSIKMEKMIKLSISQQNKLGKNGRERVGKIFSIDKVFDAYKDVLKTD